jgi:hypothetical protein
MTGARCGRACQGLLWVAGLAAVALAVAAFVLWARNGAAILFDMVLALCV